MKRKFEHFKVVINISSETKMVKQYSNMTWKTLHNDVTQCSDIQYLNRYNLISNIK